MKAGFGYQIGRRHAAETDPEMHVCQDLAAAYTDDEISVIAVADGKAGKNLPAVCPVAQLNFFQRPVEEHPVLPCHGPAAQRMDADLVLPFHAAGTTVHLGRIAGDIRFFRQQQCRTAGGVFFPVEKLLVQTTGRVSAAERMACCSSSE